MCINMDVLQKEQLSKIRQRTHRMRGSQMISKIVVCISCLTPIAAIAASPGGNVNPQISLLRVFRPIGAVGNNVARHEKSRY